MAGAVLSSVRSVPKYKKTFLISLLSFIVSAASTFAWKISDIDFITQVGAHKLTTVYICAAIVIFISSSIIVLRCSKIAAQTIFLEVQKYALVIFGILACTQLFIDSYRTIWFLYTVKIMGYAYSILLFNALWNTFDSYSNQEEPTGIQTTLYSASLYLGMTAAGCTLQQSPLGATELGLIVSILSLFSWIVGQMAFTEEQIQTPSSYQKSTVHRHHCTQFFPLLFQSKKTITLVVVSILFSILVRSTEYFFISDFELRFFMVDNIEGSSKTIGSFVTLIGLGNIITLISWQIWSRLTIGKAALPLITIVAFLGIKISSLSSYSMASAVLILMVVESLYAIVVESSLQHLLEHYDEQDRTAIRTLIDAIVEPTGLLLSAILFLIPEFSVSILGVSVICIATFVLLYNIKIGVFQKKKRSFLHGICSSTKESDQAIA